MSNDSQQTMGPKFRARTDNELTWDSLPPRKVTSFFNPSYQIVKIEDIGRETPFVVLGFHIEKVGDEVKPYLYAHILIERVINNTRVLQVLRTSSKYIVSYFAYNDKEKLDQLIAKHQPTCLDIVKKEDDNEYWVIRAV